MADFGGPCHAYVTVLCRRCQIVSFVFCRVMSYCFTCACLMIEVDALDGKSGAT